MLAYIRLVADSEDFDAFSRMYNKPNRWLGKVFLDNVATAIRGGNDLLTAISVGGVGRMTRGANEVVRHLLQAKEIYSKTNKVSDIVDYVRSIAGYDSWFVANNDTGDDEIILSNLIELSSTTARFDSIENFLSYVEIMRREYKQNENKKDVITLMTIHKAKGLEFPIVFLVGLSEGLLPHNLADELEERRLTYVAITRTMEYLFLSPLIGKTGISGYIKEIVPSFEVEKDDSNIFQYNSDNPDDPLLLEGEHDG